MSVPNIAMKIQTIRTAKENDTQRKIIHTAARVSQVFFQLGCIISAIGIWVHLTPLLSGGSFLYNTAIIGIRATEGLICYDISKMSANLASIVSSSCIQDFFKKNISNANAKAILLPLVEKIETTFALPNNLFKNLGTPPNLAKAITHDTILAKSFKPYIEKFLSH